MGGRRGMFQAGNFIWLYLFLNYPNFGNFTLGVILWFMCNDYSVPPTFIIDAEQLLGSLRVNIIAALVDKYFVISVAVNKAFCLNTVLKNRWA